MAAAVFGFTALLTFPASGAADGPSGLGVYPEELTGNNNCGNNGDFEFRWQVGGTGTFTFNNTDPDGNAYTLTVTVYSDNTFDFSFSASYSVEQVYVKAGPNTNLYDYLDALGHAVSADTGLHGPVNPDNGKFFGLSHLSFCITVQQDFEKSGTKFHDHNANGVKDAGDEGLENWVINAYADVDGDGVLDAAEFVDPPAGTDTTDANGDYSITLSPGKYIVCEEAQTDWFQSAPDNEVCAAGAPTLSPGGWAIDLQADDPGNDFGNYQQGTKSGTKVEDDDADGNITEDAANGLSGWTINVYADDGDGNLSATEYAAGTVGSGGTTDGDGNYTVSGLDPGAYIACEVLQTDWFQTFPSSGADCTTNSGATDLAQWGHAFTITSGEDETGNDFGNYQNATKAGYKFKDADGSGTNNAGDSGLNSWVIKIYSDNGATPGVLDATDTLVATDTTANDTGGNPGYYEFSGLTPGDYIVCEVGQTDWTQTAPNNTVCNADPFTEGLEPGGWAITLGSGDQDLDNDFGNSPLADFDVRFFDITGNTNATISCVDANDSSVGSTASDNINDGTANPENTLEAEDLPLGIYTCTITITDP
jgi:hypothetical protein